MRTKLSKFSAYCNTLLPHETAYLLHIQHLQDAERVAILQQAHDNSRSLGVARPFDETIDKRKYSHLKNWMEERLKDIDVDEQYNWMSELERRIMTDSILPSQEKELLRAIRQYKGPTFFFVKFFELVRHYRHFLLIRLRYRDHKVADRFLHQHELDYQRSIEVGEQLHQATLDIVNQHAENTAESKQWEDWLTEVFYNETLDGLSRYLALVRLTFMSLNYRKADRLLEKYEYLDRMFAQGRYYSRRILGNYYANRLLLHSRLRDFETAVYYGYLSLRSKNHDYLYYVNNLAAVLLRQQRNREALAVMKDAYSEMKETQNLYNKIGFVAFYLRCLNANQQYKNAENYAATFLKAFRKEIFENRWHLFFSSYLETLFLQGAYERILIVVRQNQLAEREKAYQSQPQYLPTILWYNAIALYKSAQFNERQLYEVLARYIDQTDLHADKFPQILQLLEQLRSHIPAVYHRVYLKLREKGVSFPAI